MFSKDKLMERLMKLKSDERGIAVLIEIAIIVAVLVVLFAVIPVIGYNVDSSISIPTTSNWNSVTNAAITNGTELWTQNSPMLGVGVLIGVIVVIIALLVGAIGGNGGIVGKQGGNGGL